MRVAFAFASVSVSNKAKYGVRSVSRVPRVSRLLEINIITTHQLAQKFLGGKKDLVRGLGECWVSASAGAFLLQGWL